MSNVRNTMIPVVTDKGEVLHFRVIEQLNKAGQWVPSEDNVSCYGGDTPVYWDTQAKRLRLRPDRETSGWKFYADLCNEDKKEGARFWQTYMEKIDPIVREPNKYQPVGFKAENWYHPEVAKRRGMYSETGSRIVDMTSPARAKESANA